MTGFLVPKEGYEEDMWERETFLQSSAPYDILSIAFLSTTFLMSSTLNEAQSHKL